MTVNQTLQCDALASACDKLDLPTYTSITGTVGGGAIASAGAKAAGGATTGLSDFFIFPLWTNSTSIKLQQFAYGCK
ncbi:hypothetical protein GRI58_12355 [Porphyrobacter algicida]|uniref:Uncharacterized protein n=1 Tax=Qipengyuania algicida TaxID=1836209 RepID=A0A845ARU3_9SPHN|nr:hypothetical protein [Qipengyuania algicida]MXP29608.1 hypothetical protein [Qipengyuania algicida]